MAVYFILDTVTQWIKIGYADDPQKRVRQLQTGNPNKLKLLGAVNGGQALELHYHERFKKHRRAGEWFDISRSVVSEIISGDQYIARRTGQMILNFGEEVVDKPQWVHITFVQPEEGAG